MRFLFAKNGVGECYGELRQLMEQAGAIKSHQPFQEGSIRKPRQSGSEETAKQWPANFLDALWTFGPAVRPYCEGKAIQTA